MAILACLVCVGQISSSHPIEKDQKMIQFYGSSNRFEDPWYNFMFGDRKQTDL
jgi:hypothetical protein